MPRQAKTWLLTDTHWFHDAIVPACGRPGDHMERVIRNCRQLITEADLTIHLGDVIFYKLDKLKDLLAEWPGRKVLVRGNHDSKTPGWYMRNGFAFVCDSFVIGKVMLSHKPCETLPDGVELNVHGHWHNLPWVNLPAWWTPERYRLLAMEYTDYKPVCLSTFVNGPLEPEVVQRYADARAR